MVQSLVVLSQSEAKKVRTFCSKLGQSLPSPYRYLLNEVPKCDHIKLMIIKRFLKFHRSLVTSTNPYIKVLLRYQSYDWRSTYGRNIMNICREADATDICSLDITKIKVNPVPVGEEWRVPLLKDLLYEKTSPDRFLHEDEVKLLLNFVCCD